MHRLTDGFGELVIDHRASPGLSQEQAHQVGLDGVPLGEHTCNTIPTLYCPHCGAHQIMNPNRVRPRNYCKPCNHYICDVCAVVAEEPAYQHHTLADLIEALQSGLYRLSDGPISRAVLIPIGAT